MLNDDSTEIRMRNSYHISIINPTSMWFSLSGQAPEAPGL